ncbi:MAG: BamA/TamA family outer membrane protein [Vicinamibacterales bacterium]
MARHLLFALACLLLAAPAAAQDPEPATRAELLERMREQKARNLQPAEPKGIEKTLLYIEKHRILERLSIADGWYPRIGGLTTGGGFAGGAGYRKHLVDDRLFLNASMAISTKAYKEVVADASLTELLGGWLEIGANVHWRDFPQEDFFGIGNDSAEAARTSYAFESRGVSGRVALTPKSWLRAGTEMGYRSPTIVSGTDPRFPSIEALFTDTDAPGLSAQPSFLFKSLFVAIDYRDQPGNPRSGGLWRATYGAWSDRELNQYDFGRFDAEAAHFFPVFDKKRVFAVRVGLAYVNNDPANRVPFYFLPYIGGSDTVRGFKEFRFRDENAVFLNAEYRWEAFAGLDMALFFDAGEVRPNWENIDLQDLKTSYGVGFRFNNFRSVFLRFDVGLGGEGTQIFFKFGPAF